MRVASGLVLDRPRPEQAVTLARSLVETGSVSPAVLELAGLSADPRRVNMAEVGPLFLAVLDEFGMALPSQVEAAWFAVKLLAEDILSGAIDPVIGANRFWFLSRLCDDSPELWELLGIVDDYEGGGTTRVAAAAEILANAPFVIAAADRHAPAQWDMVLPDYKPEMIRRRWWRRQS